MKIIHLEKPILIKRYQNETYQVEINNIFTNCEDVVKFFYYYNKDEIDNNEIIKFKKKYRIVNDQELVIKSYKQLELDSLVWVINVD